jgi:rhamnose utilization protein RhaD (predicted bifunctional aldolase and dehydrogenase)/NAD(P)-dependent dehydrogenase (short-subunit alcohol dehydrogenase family)
MKNRWSDREAAKLVAEYGMRVGENLALRTYTSRLIGDEEKLVLHGGGNTSVKAEFTNVLGESVPAVYVKASGHDLSRIEPEAHTCLDLENLTRLRTLPNLSDAAMMSELMRQRCDSHAQPPSIEALLHAFVSPEFIDHTHADSILALTNQRDGAGVVRDVLGDNVIVLDYVRPGFELAKAVADALDASSASKGMVLMKHGLLTWGASARESYDRTIALVTKAERYLAGKARSAAERGKLRGPSKDKTATSTATAEKRYLEVAPILRGLLAIRTENPDWPYERFVLQLLTEKKVLELVDSERGRDVALTAPLTTDHLIRTKPFPMWVDDPQYGDTDALRKQLSSALDGYANQYEEYLERNVSRMPSGLKRFDSVPRIILMPGVGAICAGEDFEEAAVVRDITSHTLIAKAKIAATGEYEGLIEEHLFDMEYHGLQHAKLDREDEPPLHRSIALVTGAAGAIGCGICEGLLRNGCHVVATDLPGKNLDTLISDLKSTHGERIVGASLDVTDPEAVTDGFRRAVRTWGGIDLVIVNAGIAHVSQIGEMDPQVFRKMEQVNTEGALHVLSEAARCFRVQGTGGDIVLISTKNVFSPGAGFGAYSASKAAAHQLARIASLEFAEMDVRVNMVAPDAVFAHGERKSGLWSEVGPERMRARGLDESGLEEYYRSRNLLKAKVTATHVAKAVLFFATRQTPTTGVTIPVDGGLPDATPR